MSFSRTLGVHRLVEQIARLDHEVAQRFSGRFGRGTDRGDVTLSLHVRVEEGTGSLILVTAGPSEPGAALLLAQAEALLDPAAGGLAYRRIDLSLGTGTAAVRRVMTPGMLGLITVRFEHEEQTRAFQPPAWFGPEVTVDPSYHSRSLALAGLPCVPEVELTDGALNSLLDRLEDRSAQRLIEPSAAEAPPPPARDLEEGAEDLGIEDSVIRELEWSPRPELR
jgi:CYTH domain-containing protein